MAHSGSASITLAKAFSASLYSKECNRAMARLKACWVSLLHDNGKLISPNCPLPQSRSSPLARSIDAKFRSGRAVLFLHPIFTVKTKKQAKRKMLFSGFIPHIYLEVILSCDHFIEPSHF